VTAAPVGKAVAHRLTRVSNELRRAQRSSVGAGSLALRRSVEQERSRVAPSGRLRNVGRNGAKLGVRYDIKGTNNPTALIRATGPWQIIENRTSAHIIVAKRLGRGQGRTSRARLAGSVSAFGGSSRGVFGSLIASTRTNRSGAVLTRAGSAALGGKLAAAAGRPRPYAFHPGTTGKKPFAKGIDRGITPAKKAVSRELAMAAKRGMTR
jgi:hypothetical protein